MSSLRQPYPAQLIFSLLCSKWSSIWPDFQRLFLESFGSLEYVSELFSFQESRYYDKELGSPVYRRILAQEKLVDPAELARIKLAAQKLEEKYTLDSGDRIVNLDPGLLFLERLVLASGKNAPQRIYLHSGVWADLTLIYKKGGWQVLPWTYPDYAGDYIQRILSDIRKNYKKKLKYLTPK